MNELSHTHFNVRVFDWGFIFCVDRANLTDISVLFSVPSFLCLSVSSNPLPTDHLKNHLMEAKLYWKEAGEACYGTGTGSDVMAARFGHAVSC